MRKLLPVLALLTSACGRMETASQLAATEVPDFERDAIALDIPDQGGPQAVLPMALESTGLVGDFKIAVKVQHTYIGDLLIYLEDPTGARVTLHNREGGNTQNIDKVYGVDGAPINKDAMLLHEVHGVWKVIIDDEASQDVGKLMYVKLDILKV